ncbi:DNA topoisomerase IB [Actinokineospora sp. 24-640]
MRRSDPHRPGLTRRRYGRGWRFLDPTGAAVADRETLERVRHLAIPPAWRDVWICPHAGGHIQAVGTDDAGRRQYLYHERWRQERDEAKHERVRELAVRLPRFRAAVHDDLSSPGLTCRRVVSGALRMLDHGVFRTGGEEYAEENGSFGVATLQRDHVTLNRGAIVFSYPAKSGVHRDLRLTDAELANLIRGLKRARTGTDRLLAYRLGRGAWQDVRSGEINERFKELTGSEYTVKDLRTWHATVVAAIAFARAEPPGTQRAHKRVEVAVMDEVAEELGNTRTIARKSYVDSRVVDAFSEGRTIRRTLDRAGADLADVVTRTAIERAVLRLLGG